MAIRFYDEAVTEKIKAWVKDPKLTILKPDETARLFEMTLDNRKDEALSLPLIAISRDKSIDIKEITKQPKTFNGWNLKLDSKCTISLNAIPIALSYQIDIYTRYMAEADEYIRNFLFNLINYPKISITLPYNDVNVTHDSIISVDPTITDNSDIREHLFPDQFTRFTIRFSIDDAYLFSIPVKTPATIQSVEVDVESSLEVDVEDTHIKEIVEVDEVL